MTPLGSPLLRVAAPSSSRRASGSGPPGPLVRVPGGG